MKNRVIAVVLALALVGLAFVLRGRNRLPASPGAAIQAFFDAASSGDDEAYLRLAANDLRRSLEETRSRLGAEAFRENLRRSVSGIKGLAVSRGGDAPEGFAAMDVEIVFADRNERQKMLLLQTGMGWAISSIEKARRIEPPIPYGTPVFEAEEAEKERKEQTVKQAGRRSP